MNISSLVIRALPKNIESLIKQLQESGLCEYHFHDTEQGKIIVTIEGEDTNEEISKHRKIEGISGVISADMMMTYSEEELEAEKDKIKSAPKVPKMLNDDSIPAEKIVYNGDLKKKKLGF